MVLLYHFLYGIMVLSCNPLYLRIFMRRIMFSLCLLSIGLTYIITARYRTPALADACSITAAPTPGTKLDDKTLAYKTLTQEVVMKQLPIKGALPPWLSGRFFYNGPAQFELNGKPFNHTFDGFAMIHAFNIHQGTISYTNKFLETQFKQRALKAGKLSLGFVEEGSGSSWKIINAVSSFMRKPKTYDNTNINVMMLGDHAIACTETPHHIEFDAHTLKTLGSFSVIQDQQAHICTAHPLYDVEKKVWYNIYTQFGHTSTYHVIKIHPISAQSTILASLPVNYPGYMHSFALSKNYIILIESPLVVNPYDFLGSSKPFIENFVWKPQQKTRLIVINKHTGKQEKILVAPAFFMFHQVNAYETSPHEITLDIITYPDINIIQSSSRVSQLCCATHEKDKGTLQRYKLNLKTEKLETKNIIQQSLEFPAINQDYQGVAYTYMYGINHRDNTLLKINLETNASLSWQEKGCFVGQPIFVSNPKAMQEDDGVILSLILDTIHQYSFLLILDAKTMKELARAIAPHHIPLGFHGIFVKNK